MFGNDECDSRLSVQTSLGADLFAAILGVAKIFDLDRITAAGGDDHIIKFFGFLYLSDRANGGFRATRVNAPRWKLHILDLQRTGKFGRRHVVRTELVRIDPDIYLPFLSADDRDLADAVDRFDAFLDPVFGDIRNLAERCRCRNGNTQHRSCVRIQFLNGRLFGRLRKMRYDGLDSIFDLLGGNVHILFENELNKDLCDAFDRARPQLVDAANCIDRFFDLIGDLGFDLLRRRTGVYDRDRDRRKVDLREKVNAEAQERKRSHDHERQDQHRGKNGTLNTNFSKPLHNLLVHLPDEHAVEQGVDVTCRYHIALGDAVLYLDQPVFKQASLHDFLTSDAILDDVDLVDITFRLDRRGRDHNRVLRLSLCDPHGRKLPRL